MATFKRIIDHMKTAFKRPYYLLSHNDLDIEQKGDIQAHTSQSLGKEQTVNLYKIAMASIALLSWSILMYVVGSWYPNEMACALRTLTWCKSFPSLEILLLIFPAPAQSIVRYEKQIMTGNFYQSRLTEALATMLIRHGMTCG